MSVKTHELENPERDLDLSTRDEGRRGGRKREETDAAELQALRERIEAARRAQGPEPGVLCQDCCRRGRRAALRALDGEGGLPELRGRIEAAMATTPRDPEPHSGASFLRGYEAVLIAVSG